MTENNREIPDRRRVERGGRRESDRLALTPAMREEATQLAATITTCLQALTAALEDGDLSNARNASKALKTAADALRTLLTGGSSRPDAS